MSRLNPLISQRARGCSASNASFVVHVCGMRSDHAPTINCPTTQEYLKETTERHENNRAVHSPTSLKAPQSHHFKRVLGSGFQRVLLSDNYARSRRVEANSYNWTTNIIILMI